MRFWKCEFCEKWDFEIVNFVKNEILKLWMLSKMRLWNCEFCEIWDFEIVNFVKNKIFWTNWGFLPQCGEETWKVMLKRLACPGIQVFEWVFPTFVFLCLGSSCLAVYSILPWDGIVAWSHHYYYSVCVSWLEQRGQAKGEEARSHDSLFHYYSATYSMYYSLNPR